MKSMCVVAFSIVFCSSAYAQSPAVVSTGVGTPGPAGSPVVIQTDTLPLHTVGGVSIGAYSSTTVVGGANTNGSGGIIPNGSAGSTANTVRGLNITYPPPPPPPRK